MESNNQGQQPVRQSLSGGGKSKTGTIIASLIGIAVLLLIVALVRQSLSGGGKKDEGVNKSNMNVEAVNGNQQGNTNSNIPVDTSGWKTYRNEEYGFELKYPPTEKAGDNAQNSTLGTTEDPVPGIFIGPLVLIPLKEDNVKNKAERSISTLIEEAQVETSDDDYDGPSRISCKNEQINNSSAKIMFFECTGEGGFARYAYIDSEGVDFFIDGYSGGYDIINENNHPRYKKSEEIKASLASIIVY